MTSVYQYRIYCTTDQKYITTWSTTEPTVCPENNNHSIDTGATTILQTISNTEVNVKEESIPTGGSFASRTLRVDSKAHTANHIDFWWSHAISALSANFVTGKGHIGDSVSMYVGPNTTIGAIMAPVFPAAPWQAQNYTLGQSVLFPHPVFGSRVYTCIQDTTINNYPLDINYWKHGTALTVTPTVLAYAQLGYYIRLFDGAKMDEWLRVIGIDKALSKIYVEGNITSVYSPLSPTYVQMTVAVLKDFELGEPCEHAIGESKIGGSYVPPDTIIRFVYKNNSSEDKYLIGRVEYLY